MPISAAANMTSNLLPRRYPDGRDEMNLADFPISALQRTQPNDGAGGKLDRLEFEATRYDAYSRQRVSQKVTLTASAREGLPTPADEHVILALLYVAKHGDNFAGDTVHFAPAQLFDIMGWAPNGRSYSRLRSVLRRLKSLTIRYENAWWDAAGRAYEEEVATGIVSGYRIARQVSGPRTAATRLVSWVTWSQQFHESLRKGNLKRLDLDVFFRLSSPTAQRMYRFLDKRFYTTPLVAMDLTEFACGHIGLTETKNVAILKRRLAPAIAELESIRFVAEAPLEDRYRKVKPGVWRVEFKPGYREASTTSAIPFAPPANAAKEVAASDPLEPRGLALEFYRLWDASAGVVPGPRDLEMASELLRLHGAAANGLIACLVQVTRKRWPDCRSLSGAAQKYLADALKLQRAHERRALAQRDAIERRRQERVQRDEQQALERQLAAAWQALPNEEQATIRGRVQAQLGAIAPEAFVRRLCLDEMARRQRDSQDLRDDESLSIGGTP